ncbi:hypothetical protein F3I62_15965 [Pseudomonas sp. R-28-1W-6]|uniref:hypothetical protein n=1 Tax=Pseudomonas sp. R-28-1W-6 TaxID=2650101 RepID=UPI0013664948|nr:hypothetical protein [Pseudomonas sp. R-28-1W-6]MWV13599.1 hypothetical protein [Pseudomonas sp. R-28-1W-6]
MKLTHSKTALSGLFLALTVTTGAVLAEGGGIDRINEFRIRNQQAMQMKEESSESFARMVEEQPTAAGRQSEQDEMQPAKQPAPQYRSTIQQQRFESRH